MRSIRQYNLATVLSSTFGERPCFYKMKSNRGRYPALISSLHTDIKFTGQKCIRIRPVVYVDLCIFFFKVKKKPNNLFCVCIYATVCGGRRTTCRGLVLSSIMWVLAVASSIVLRL